MSLMQWREAPIAKRHKRAQFDCGEPNLNEFLAKYARQAHESSASKTYVALTSEESVDVLGFYTLCPAQVHFAQVPPSVMPAGAGHHPLGCFRLAKLAVSLSQQGSGLGGQLLVAAVRRCVKVSSQVGGSFLLVDAKDVRAANWYKLYGAIEIPEKPLSLVLPYANIPQNLLKN